ncbi:MAG: hypothetical protein HY788_03540 [Deltaproteobacteria bacterium]|nr:hypothetical protein [Deltaproteobacteria bacterium]
MKTTGRGLASLFFMCTLMFGSTVVLGAVTIGNGIQGDGKWEVVVDVAGDSTGGTLDPLGPTGLTKVVFWFFTAVEVGEEAPFQLIDTDVTTPPTLKSGTNEVESAGLFPGPNGTVNWKAVSSIEPDSKIYRVTLTFESMEPLGALRLINYLDGDSSDSSNDLLVVLNGSEPEDIRLLVLGKNVNHGVAQATEFSSTLNASFLGWAADRNAGEGEDPDLLDDIVDISISSDEIFSPTGNVYTENLPVTSDSRYPDKAVYGPNDVTTAMAFDLDPTATSATVTFLLGASPDGDSPFSDGPTQQGPTARAGTDQTVVPGAQVTLDGSASSDPDDGIASYAWDQTEGPDVVLSDATAVQPTFPVAAGVPEGTVYTFNLTVMDHTGLSSSDTVSVVVQASQENRPPVADAGADKTAVVNSLVTLDGSGSSDPDNDIASYSWVQTGGPTVELSNAGNVMSTFTPVEGTPEGVLLTFTLTVADSHGLTDTDTTTVRVFPPDIETNMPDGIYKDEGPQPVISAYIQTYTVGSMLVILTPDLQDWYVFIDDDWEDGLSNVSDLGGIGHRLNMSFVPGGKILTVLSYAGGGSETWTLTRTFAALENSPPADGIYKQEQENGMNLYLQTYSAGSSLFIFTPNLVDWTVFLDEDYSNGLAVSGDLAGMGKSLVMTPNGAGSYQSTITGSQGMNLTFQLDLVFSAPGGTAGQ